MLRRVLLFMAVTGLLVVPIEISSGHWWKAFVSTANSVALFCVSCVKARDDVRLVRIRVPVPESVTEDVPDMTPVVVYEDGQE